MNIYANEVLSSLTPYPLLLPDNRVLEGMFVKRHASCIACYSKNNMCPKIPGVISPKTCDMGFRIYPTKIVDENVVVFGIVTEFSRHKLPANIRERLSRYAVQEDSVAKWAGSVTGLINKIDLRLSEKSKEYAEAFHDINPSIGLLYRNAEAVLLKYPGTNFSERFESAPEDIKTLYKSGQLLQMRLNLMSIFSNPDVVYYGNKTSTPVYKIADKLTKLFYAEAKKLGLQIKLVGKSFNTPKVYPSFENIFFILIENAVKYSIKRQDITIGVQDVANGAVEIYVESYGPVIPSNLVAKVFEKKFRYIAPGLDKRPGSGLGLYLAKIVAAAHGFEISYTGNPENSMNDTPIGLNRFRFVVG